MKAANIPLHVFVFDGITNTGPLKDARYCAHCPLPESRTDVHTLPETPEDTRDAEARRYGDRP